MLERIRDMFRSAATGKILTRAVQAYQGEDLATARAAVDEAVTATEHPGSRSQETHRRSLRLIAVCLRAEVADKQGDDAVARASIEEGFALWDALRHHPAKTGIRSVEAYQSWEKWARGWLERKGKPGA